MRRLLIIVAMVLAAAFGGATAVSADWACAGIVPLDTAVCVDDPLPGPPPLPSEPAQPVL